MNQIKLSGVLGLLGAILCGTGEFLLHFDECRLGLGETGFDFMINTSEARLNGKRPMNYICRSFFRCNAISQRLSGFEISHWSGSIA